MTPEQAVGHGDRTVNGTVFLCMFGLPVAAGGIAYLLSWSTDVALAAAVVMFVPGLVSAWIAWSVLTPRWRIWAYERVDDLDALKRLAVARNLLWPDGHWLEKTEIRSREQRRRIAELEDAWRRRNAL